MQLLEFYQKVCETQRGILQVRFASDSLLHALITTLRKQFIVETFDDAPSPHQVGAGNLFQRTIFVAPYDKKLEKATPGGTLILVVKKGSRKSIIDVELPPIETIQASIVHRLGELGISIDDTVFHYAVRIAKGDPAEIKTMFSLISTYLVGAGGDAITRKLVDYFYPQEADIKPFTLFNYLVEPPDNIDVLWNEFEDNLKRFGAALPMVAALTTMALKKYYVILGVETGTELAQIEEVTGLTKLNDRFVHQDLPLLPRICRLLLQLTLIRHEIVAKFYNAEIVLRARLLEYVGKNTQVSPSLL